MSESSQGNREDLDPTDPFTWDSVPHYATDNPSPPYRTGNPDIGGSGATTYNSMRYDDHVGYPPLVMQQPSVPRSGMAVASLVLGIVGLFVSWITFGVPSLLALIFGIIGLRETAADRKTGRAQAVGGTVLGAIVMIGGLLATLLIIGAIGTTAATIATVPTISATTEPSLEYASPGGSTADTSDTHPAAVPFGRVMNVSDSDGESARMSVSAPTNVKKDSEFAPDPEHGRFVSFLVNVTADSGATFTYNALDWYVRGPDGAHYDGTYAGDTDKALNSGVLNSGEHVAGTLTFDVPAGHGTLVYAPNLTTGSVAEWSY